jgi:hypothetical protein
MSGLFVGKMVNYVLGENDVPESYAHKVGSIRPAVITQQWGDPNSGGCVNLTVFADWSNDGIGQTHEFQGTHKFVPAPCIWATSRAYSPEGLPYTFQSQEETQGIELKRAEAATAPPKSVQIGNSSLPVTSEPAAGVFPASDVAENAAD